MSSSLLKTAQPHTFYKDSDEEREGLLRNEDEAPFVKPEPDSAESTTVSQAPRVAWVAFTFVVLLVGGIITRATLCHPSGNIRHFSGSETRSNGTHDFKRTVLMVSIDGLRCVFAATGLERVVG